MDHTMTGSHIGKLFSGAIDEALEVSKMKRKMRVEMKKMNRRELFPMVSCDRDPLIEIRS
jgi:hypothetical protein